MKACVHFAVFLLWWWCCDAVSLIGQGIFFPLVPTDPLHFNAILESNNSLLGECAKKESLVWIQKHQNCSREYEMKRNLYENSDPIKACSLNLEFLHCFKKVMKELEEVCEWSDDKFLVYSYPVRAFESSLHYACKNDAQVYNEYYRMGRGPVCVSKSRPDLRYCMELHQPSIPLAYDEHNCRVAWDFYGCVGDKLYDTCLKADIDFIDMCAQIIVEGLKPTPCWGSAPKYLVKEMEQPAEEPEDPTAEDEPDTPEYLPNTSNSADPENDTEPQDSYKPSDGDTDPPETETSEEPHDPKPPKPRSGGRVISSSSLQTAVMIFFLYVSVAP